MKILIDIFSDFTLSRDVYFSNSRSDSILNMAYWNGHFSSVYSSNASPVKISSVQCLQTKGKQPLSNLSYLVFSLYLVQNEAMD